MNEYLTKKKKRNRLIFFSQIIILFIFLWEIFSMVGILNDFLFSSPSKIIKLLKVYLDSNELFIHIGISLLETILGLMIGTVCGIIIAIIIWWFPLLSKISEPFLVILNALPKTALAPILIIWAGTGIKGITAVAVSISLVLTIISCYNYFSSVEYEKIKMLKTFNASKFQILYYLILPSNLPNIISIIKINIGMTWVGVIVGEFLVSRAGIGYLIVYGSQVFRMDIVMMGVIVLAIIAFGMYEIVNIFEKKIKKGRGIL